MKFPLSDQLIQKIENSKFKCIIKIVNFKINTLNVANTNRLILLISKLQQQEQEKLFDEKIEREGLKNWLEIFSNVHNWKIKNEHEIFRILFKPQADPFPFSSFISKFKKEKSEILNSSSFSMESFYKLLTKDSNFRKHFTLNDQAIIDFCLKFNFYRQLVCLLLLIKRTHRSFWMICLFVFHSKTMKRWERFVKFLNI